jgi:hypothetical protein
VTADHASFRSIGANLVTEGFLPHTPWWDENMGRGYARGVKRFAFRVGRGGVKSTTMVDAAINEAVFGDWKIPPGEVHYFAFVSQNKSEAGQRLRQIAARLRALGIPFDQSGDEIVLRDMPRGFRVFACQVGSVSGFRCFGFCADELAKWTNADHSANPAPEVVASLRAMTVTHPDAREFFVSSPMGTSDLHYEIIEQGDTADQIVGLAPTWIANPSVTEEQTHRLEPDERIWRREYAAQPQAQLSSAFDPDSVARAFRPVPHAAEWSRAICIVDASSGGGDAFTHGFAQYGTPVVDYIPRYLTRLVPRIVHTRIGGVDRCHEDHDDLVPHQQLDAAGNPVPNPEWLAATKPLLCFHGINAFEGRFAGQIAGSTIVDKIAKDCRRWRAEIVIGDQREAFFLGSECQRHGLRFVPLTWTNANKIEAVTRLKRQFAENGIVLPPEREKLKRELLSYAERITATGTITYSARGTGHDDEVSLLITCAMAELERLVPGSPAYFPNVRTITSGR